MKKGFFFIACLLCLVAARGQLDHFITVNLSANFDFAVKSPSMDDAGIGLQADLGLFANKRLMLLITGEGNRYMGDKSFYEPGIGRMNKAGAMYGLHAGPQFFIFRKLALTATYGVFWHSINAKGFTSDDGYRFGLVAYPGKSRRFILKFNRTTVPAAPVNIRDYAAGIGWRIS